MNKDTLAEAKDAIPDVDVTVEGFTVSYSFDVYQNGAKASNFVSMNFKFSRPVSPEEALLLEIAHGSTVTDAAIYGALARGNITTETANDLVQQSRERHAKIVAKLAQKFR